jgi:hypothetical protein
MVLHVNDKSIFISASTYIITHITRVFILGGSGQLESYGGPPKSFFSLGVEQFNRNLDAMRGEYKDEEPQGKFDSVFFFFLLQFAS